MPTIALPAARSWSRGFFLIFADVWRATQVAGWVVRLIPDWQICVSWLVERFSSCLASWPMLLVSAPPAELLASLRSPFGPACGRYSALLRSSCWPRENNQREGHPGIQVRPAARPPSFRCRSGGRLTMAVPGPLSLSLHPCSSSPCATPTLGLLTGTAAPRYLGDCRCASPLFCRRGLGRDAGKFMVDAAKALLQG